MKVIVAVLPERSANKAVIDGLVTEGFMPMTDFNAKASQIENDGGEASMK